MLEVNKLSLAERIATYVYRDDVVVAAWCNKCCEVTTRGKAIGRVVGQCKSCIRLYRKTPESKLLTEANRSTPKAKEKKAAYDGQSQLVAKRKVHAKRPQARVQQATARALPEAKRKAETYRALPKNRARMAVFNCTPEAKAKRAEYEASTAGKTVRQTIRNDRRAKLDELLNNLALSVGVKEFLDTVNNERIANGKKPYINEAKYQRILYHALVNAGVVCQLEYMNGMNSDCYDLFLPELKVIIETKIPTTKWNQSDINNQINRYSINNPDFQVIGSSPNAEFDLLNFYETIATVIERQEQVNPVGC